MEYGKRKVCMEVNKIFRKVKVADHNKEVTEALKELK
jgi:peroxiredoxin